MWTIINKKSLKNFLYLPSGTTSMDYTGYTSTWKSSPTPSTPSIPQYAMLSPPMSSCAFISSGSKIKMRILYKNSNLNGIFFFFSGITSPYSHSNLPGVTTSPPNYNITTSIANLRFRAHEYTLHSSQI